MVSAFIHLLALIGGLCLGFTVAVCVSVWYDLRTRRNVVEVGEASANAEFFQSLSPDHPVLRDDQIIQFPEGGRNGI